MSAKDRLIAICDAEIKGKTFKHKGVNLTVKEQFYGNDIYEKDEVLKEIKNCTSLNAFGENICNLLIENELVHPATVLWIKNGEQKIGHVLIVK